MGRRRPRVARSDTKNLNALHAITVPDPQVLVTRSAVDVWRDAEAAALRALAPTSNYAKNTSTLQWNFERLLRARQALHELGQALPLCTGCAKIVWLHVDGDIICTACQSRQKENLS